MQSEEVFLIQNVKVIFSETFTKGCKTSMNIEINFLIIKFQNEYITDQSEYKSPEIPDLETSNSHTLQIS